MKFMFKEGKYDLDEENLIFSDSEVISDDFFSERRVMLNNNFQKYRIYKCSNDELYQDIFVVYDSDEEDFAEKVQNELLNLSHGNYNSLLNKEESSLYLSLIGADQNNLFWDVINNLLIIFGENNLKQFLDYERKDFVRKRTHTIPSRY